MVTDTTAPVSRSTAFFRIVGQVCPAMPYLGDSRIRVMRKEWDHNIPRRQRTPLFETLPLPFNFKSPPVDREQNRSADMANRIPRNWDERDEREERMTSPLATISSASIRGLDTPRFAAAWNVNFSPFSALSASLHVEFHD
jgi:hypothetical protein